MTRRVVLRPAEARVPKAFLAQPLRGSNPTLELRRPELSPNERRQRSRQADAHATHDDPASQRMLHEMQILLLHTAERAS